ncbi:unnamed protein product, partial [Mesorhabditis spiculigera]
MGSFDCDLAENINFLLQVTVKLYELRDFLVESDVRVFVVFAKDDCMATILLDIQALGYKRGDLQFVLPSVPLNDSNLDILEYAYAVDDYIELVDTFENVIMNTPIKDTETAWVTVFGKYNPLEELEPAEDNVDPIDIPILSAILNETRTCQKDCENEIANFQPGCCWSCTACPTFAVVNATVQV